ncbi:hypothetical protein QTO34_006912 [Cnephaeus nilssonii]|uniref:Mitochondrial S-adenosylmethionine carrier protein n=1 Tax=Cnephaeus nilssonii TaxID=3371016 RepID=A0AA40HK50_CNENI|nr:hypothetical protein QTO34_006912 [Eptesicus nilssonii]
MDRPGFTASLVAGGVAGVSVDLILFPLDTIKTRLQSPQGFNKAGGFHGIYAGVPSAAIGSFPNAAAFFITYDYVKWLLHTDSSSHLMPVKHMLAASAGEVVACLIRVPSEVVKQRAQVSASSRTFQIFSNILYQEGIPGLYRGYKSTVLREVTNLISSIEVQKKQYTLFWQRTGVIVLQWCEAVCPRIRGAAPALSVCPLVVDSMDGPGEHLLKFHTVSFMGKEKKSVYKVSHLIAFTFCTGSLERLVHAQVVGFIPSGGLASSRASISLQASTRAADQPRLSDQAR